MEPTAVAAEPFYLNGQVLSDHQYQRTAMAVFPLLVRQAQLGQFIEYGVLAKEVGMTFPLNLNFPLGCIGKTLALLGESDEWGKPIPMIQALVVRKGTSVPGVGIEPFLRLPYSTMSVKQRQTVENELMNEIVTYSHWFDLLDLFGLAPASEFATDVELDVAGTITDGKGEGEQHAELKEYVLKHPEILDIKFKIVERPSEKSLPSGDKLDVSFCGRKNWVAAEVKPPSAPEGDILRGIFQCVKYHAVMHARELLTGQRNVEVFLVLGGPMPQRFIGIAANLRVQYIDNITSSS